MEKLKKYGIRHCVLNNGLKVFVKKLPINEVHIELMVGCGVVHENKDNNGISHLLEHMIGEDGQIKDRRKRPIYKLERFGAEIIARTSEIDTVYSITVSRQYAMWSLKLLLNMITSVEFTEKDFLRERSVVLSEIDYAGESFYNKIIKRLFPNHPLSLPVRGTKNTIPLLTSRQIKKWHERLYQPQRMTLIVVGDVNLSQIKRAVKKSKLSELQNVDIAIDKVGPVKINWQAKTEMTEFNENKVLIIVFGPSLDNPEASFYFKLIMDFLSRNTVFSLEWYILRKLYLYSGLVLDTESVTPYISFLQIYLDASSQKKLKKIERRFWVWINRVVTEGLGKDAFLNIKRQANRRLQRDMVCGDWWANLIEDAVGENFLDDLSLYLDTERISKERLDKVFKECFEKTITFRSLTKSE